MYMCVCVCVLPVHKVMHKFAQGPDLVSIVCMRVRMHVKACTLVCIYVCITRAQSDVQICTGTRPYTVIIIIILHSTRLV